MTDTEVDYETWPDAFAAWSEIKDKYVDVNKMAPARTPNDPADNYHLPDTAADEPARMPKNAAVFVVSLDVEAHEVSSETSLRSVIAQCFQTAIARKKRVEFEERTATAEERRALAGAKRGEFASWLDNRVIDLADCSTHRHDLFLESWRRRRRRGRRRRRRGIYSRASQA